MVTTASPAQPISKAQKPPMFGPCTHTLNRGRPCHGVAFGSGDLICVYCGQWMGYAFTRPLPIRSVLPATGAGVATQAAQAAQVASQVKTVKKC